MLQVGITGGIGSGKSVIARVFSLLGVPVYDADAAAKKLMRENERLKNELIRQFGEACYPNGVLDTNYLASLVFDHPDRLNLLNSIVHPAVLADAANWFKQQQGPYAIKEAALLFESGTAKDLDLVIGVSSPSALRIKRVMERSNLTREEVLQRMNKQLDESIKMRLCDFVIVNNEQELVLPQVMTIHRELLKRSEQKPSAS